MFTSFAHAGHSHAEDEVHAGYNTSPVHEQFTSVADILAIVGTIVGLVVIAAVVYYFSSKKKK